MDMNQKEMIMERKEVEFRPGKRYLHSFFLLDLEKIAIKRIQSASEMALGYYGKPLVVLTAEGKDSAVCRELVRRSGVPHELMHNLTTADAPETFLLYPGAFPFGRRSRHSMYGQLSLL